MLQIAYESFSLILAIMAGIRAYSYLNIFYRILFFQVVSWFVVYLCSYLITSIQKQQHIEPNNQWIFNLHLFIETFLLLMAAFFYKMTRALKSIVVFLFLFFLSLFSIRIGLNGLKVFDHYLFIAQGVVVFVAYGMLLYNFLHLNNFSFKSPEIWIVIGLLLYFACNVPYFSLFNYLNNHHPKLSETLFHVITDVLANMRYLFLAIGFWLIRYTNNLKQATIHE